MTTQQILNLSQRELEKLTERELKQTVSTLRSTARKRYERIQEADIFSEAAYGLHKKSEGQETIFPTVKDMDTTQLFNEYKKYRAFLSSKTSTVKGAKKANKDKTDFVNDFITDGQKLTSEEANEILKMADDLKDEINYILSSTDRISALAQVYSEDKKMSKSELLETAKERITKQYERDNPTTPLAIYPSQIM